MKVYIAGPMSGLPNFNRDRFNEIAGLVVESGNIPLNTAILPDGLSERDYMAIGIAMLQCADAIYLLEGWEKSAGARAEKTLADKLNIPRIRFLIAGWQHRRLTLPDWLPGVTIPFYLEDRK
ncbi:nucleoside 2-deoxyribosyltransferase [Salmonella enterica]|nr:nucleoside 2-deoxyribosyltransferase [Salmonella enterica]